MHTGEHTWQRIMLTSSSQRTQHVYAVLTQCALYKGSSRTRSVAPYHLELL